MVEDDLSKESSSEPFGKLEKLKEYLAVGYGAGATVTGVATGNPFLATSGIISFFGGFISPFANRNQNKFFASLKLDLEKLESKIDGFNVDKVLSEDRVLSAILEVHPTVLRTYHEEKLELLRNAVLNCAINTIDEDLQSVYFKLIDELTPTHVKILKFLEDPTGFIKKYNISEESIATTNRNYAIPRAMPEIRDTYPLFLKYLEDNQLIMKHEGIEISIKDELKPNITVYGKNFLKLIESPFKNESSHNLPL